MKSSRSQVPSTLTLNSRNFLRAHPALMHDVASYGLAHLLYNHIKHFKGPRLNRRQIRKIKNRRRRWFIDNIIMHHKRIHDSNRDLTIRKAKGRSQQRKKILKSSPKAIESITKGDQDTKWRNSVSIRERGAKIRGRIDSRRLRARSRWVSLVNDYY